MEMVTRTGPSQAKPNRTELKNEIVAIEIKSRSWPQKQRRVSQRGAGPAAVFRGVSGRGSAGARASASAGA